jgi:hypothetical protein
VGNGGGCPSDTGECPVGKPRRIVITLMKTRCYFRYINQSVHRNSLWSAIFDENRRSVAPAPPRAARWADPLYVASQPVHSNWKLGKECALSPQVGFSADLSYNSETITRYPRL